MNVLSAAGLSVRHGFLGRDGGVSRPPFDSLNLSLARGDDPAAVTHNRALVRERFGGTPRLLEQVHGDRVVRASADEPAADAHHSDDPEDLLVISTADCLPVLFHDPASGAVAAAHCGWKGTALHLAARVVEALVREYGSRPADLQVALGPCICSSCYQVGPEFGDRFGSAGLSAALSPDAAAEGRFRLDLVAANTLVLESAGVLDISVTGHCTICGPGKYFSHRRDAAFSGRQWSLIRAG